jgi:hypothetical protein
MRDSRDYVIAVLAALLLFCVGLLIGQEVRILPEASAQGTSAGTPGGVKAPPEAPVTVPLQPTGLTPTPQTRPGLEGRTTASRPTDSNSNNRFVAVTCPTLTGESVLFLIDSEQEQVTVYRFQQGQGLEFLASRKIEYDLKVSGYRDVSEFSYDRMREMYQQEVSRQAAKAAAAK